MDRAFPIGLIAAATVWLTSPAIAQTQPQRPDADTPSPTVQAAKDQYRAGYHTEAIAALKAAIAHKDKGAVVGLADVYFGGETYVMSTPFCSKNSLSPQEGLQLLQTHGEAGEADAMLALAENYRDSDCFKNPSQAIVWYQKAAEIGRLQAKASLAEMYALGEGVPKDLEKAGYWRDEAFKQTGGKGFARENALLVLSDGKGDSAFMRCGTANFSYFYTSDCPAGWPATPNPNVTLPADICDRVKLRACPLPTKGE